MPRKLVIISSITKMEIRCSYKKMASIFNLIARLSLRQIELLVWTCWVMISSRYSRFNLKCWPYLNMLNFYTLCIYFFSFDAKFSLILLCKMLSCLIIPILKSSHVNLQFINFPFDSTFYLFPLSTMFVDRIFRLISHLWDH